VELADEFRKKAHQCLARAQEAPALQHRTYWLDMAQFWLNLAQHAHEDDVTGRGALGMPADESDSGGKSKI
jgi:hypothetical protein